jgi:hypothetical protein
MSAYFCIQKSYLFIILIIIGALIITLAILNSTNKTDEAALIEIISDYERNREIISDYERNRETPFVVEKKPLFELTDPYNPLVDVTDPYNRSLVTDPYNPLVDLRDHYNPSVDLIEKYNPFINMNYSSPFGSYKIVGFVKKIHNGEYSKKRRDTFQLLCRRKRYTREKYEYVVVREESEIYIPIDGIKNNSEISTGDNITIPGHTGVYEAYIYELEKL